MKEKKPEDLTRGELIQELEARGRLLEKYIAQVIKLETLLGMEAK
jgi:uncharacterized protein YdeI (YjbR/CyaY-like superfamily)